MAVDMAECITERGGGPLHSGSHTGSLIGSHSAPGSLHGGSVPSSPSSRQSSPSPPCPMSPAFRLHSPAHDSRTPPSPTYRLPSPAEDSRTPPSPNVYRLPSPSHHHSRASSPAHSVADSPPPPPPPQPIRATNFFIADILKPEFGRKSSRDHLCPDPRQCQPAGLPLGVKLQLTTSPERRHGPTSHDDYRHQYCLGPRSPSPGAFSSHSPLKEDGRSLTKSSVKPEPGSASHPSNDSLVWPAWVYCTRYSDRPSSGKFEVCAATATRWWQG